MILLIDFSGFVRVIANRKDGYDYRSSWDKSMETAKLVLTKLVLAVLGSSVVAVLVGFWLGVNNEAPQAVITVDNPPQADTEDTINVFSGMELKFSSIKSWDKVDGNNLQYRWELWSLQDDRKDKIHILDKEGIEGISYEPPPLNPGQYLLVLAVRDTRRKNGFARYQINVSESTPEPNDNNAGENVWDSWWQPWNSSRGIPPEGSLIVSFEEDNSKQRDPLFLCRAFDPDEGRWKPGKVVALGDCLIPLYQAQDGQIKHRQTLRMQSYEVFIPKGSWQWLSSTDNRDGKHIVSADLNHPSVVCRISYGQEVGGKMRKAKHPGLLDETINRCIFPWGDVVGYLDTSGNPDTYEILTIQ